ncbi:sialin [Trichoplusia ni]|uniref:Sialin n=1 Tax=Trichoplusia ni TaxID=7111 RepID=A0A7E5W5P3_TRINI|nr:sialin [Trichoplusia ni]
METQRQRKLPPARYVLAILGCMGFATIYGLRVNLSVALVGMLNHTALLQIEAAEAGKKKAGAEIMAMLSAEASSKPNVEDGPFVWSSQIQGLVLSCYFWGYLVAQIPGGRLAELYSAKWVMFGAVFINAVCTILTPVMCKIHYVGVIIMRVLEGLGGGTAFPAMHCMLSKWAPPAERSFISAVTYAGTSLGTVISTLSAGMIIASFGWEMVFYSMGGASLIWCVMWVMLVQDTPQRQKYITEEERTMIITSLQNTDESKEKPKVPWRAVVTSSAFLAILVAHVCNNFGWYMLLIELPFYMNQVLKFNIKENAVAVSLPYLTLWIFSMFISKLLDHLRSLSYLTMTSARKIATLIASVVPGSCLLVLCFIAHRGVAVALMALAVTCNGAIFSGFLSNHIDIAPNFAGTLMALTNTVGTVPGVIVPLLVGYITHGNQTLAAWRIVFLIAVALYVLEIVVYTWFASGEVQPWNVGSQPSNKQPAAPPAPKAEDPKKGLTIKNS